MKLIEKILKEIVDSTSITDICNGGFCEFVSPVVDPIIFPEFHLFTSSSYKESIIFLLVLVGIFILSGFILEEILKRVFQRYCKNEENRVVFNKIFEKVMIVCISFYCIKAIIYFIIMKRH
ncbi:hypothetical protein [Bacillus gaemokensis]|uniref:Uncharacterized protein n=1 Tax=Bacillus gaemokensis TaxID=574375 RepID=A0A073KR45_9BACI|nr:hypothetical protein [Bacillus gaemokensis]KEK24878.1 hypothetical protein BAGA_21605 [Bacillus gaemokensis]KYG30188.1 hypothetical protein AZF08_12615 [Bacillus gaemokensis]